MNRNRIVVTALFLLALAGGAFAAQQKKTPMKKPASTSASAMRLEGEIAAIDTGTHRLTLKVQEAGKTVERELVTDDHTKVLDAGKTVQLSALKVGEKVAASYHKDGTRMIASEVTVKRS